MPLNLYLIYFPIYKIKENKEMSVEWFESLSEKLSKTEIWALSWASKSQEDTLVIENTF